MLPAYPCSAYELHRQRFYSTSNHFRARYVAGTLVECDPSIKSIIMNIDKDKNDYIIEDLDDSHLLIKDAMVAQLKARLEEVSTWLTRLAMSTATRL